MQSDARGAQLRASRPRLQHRKGRKATRKRTKHQRGTRKGVRVRESSISQIGMGHTGLSETYEPLNFCAAVFLGIYVENNRTGPPRLLQKHACQFDRVQVATLFSCSCARVGNFLQGRRAPVACSGRVCGASLQKLKNGCFERTVKLSSAP